MNKFKLIVSDKKIIDERVFPLAAEALGQKAKLLAEVSFVDEEEIRRLNKEFRDTDKVTDVLSFPSIEGIRGAILNKEDYPFDLEGGRINIGSIAICSARAREQALEYGNTFERECTYLTLHGILHLFGYDHMTDEDKKQMREIEKSVMAQMGYKE